MATQVDFPTFLTRVRQSVEAGATVSYRLLTEDRHSVMVTLEGGRIVFVRHGAYQGAKAIPHIARLQGGTLGIDTDPVFIRQRGLPPTDEILRSWEAAASEGAGASALLGVSLPPDLTWNDEVKGQVQQVLKQFIGPIAPLIIDNASKELGLVDGQGGLERLLGMLAGELEGSKDRERFYAQIRQRLG